MEKEWILELEQMPDFEQCMKRICAWFEQELIDRPPIRFSAHNGEYSESHLLKDRSWPSLKDRWWDTDYQIELFEHQLKNSAYNAETFYLLFKKYGFNNNSHHAIIRRYL